MDKTNRKKLSRERILDAAMNIVDKDGITALSMRKLGSELGIEAMTLYYYIPNKNALLDNLVDRVVSNVLMEMTDITGQTADWSHWMRTLAVSLRRELLQHPNLLPLVATRPVMSSDSIRAVEKIAASLCEAGFRPLHAFHVINTVTTFVIGQTLAEAGHTPGHEESEPDTAGLHNRLAPSQYPCFIAAIEAGLGQPDGYQACFDFALDALLAGLVINK